MVRTLVQDQLGIRHLLPLILRRLPVRGALFLRAVEFNERTPRLPADPVVLMRMLLSEAEQALRFIETARIPQIPRGGENLRREVIQLHLIAMVEFRGDDPQLLIRFVHTAGPRKRLCIARAKSLRAIPHHLTEQVGGGAPIRLENEQS